MKYKPQGIYWPPAQGGRGGGRRKYFLSRAPRSFSHTRFARRCFRKERKEKKITSVYRLDCYFNQHCQHRTNQKVHSCANAVLQNRGVCGQAFPCLPPSPVIPLFFALVPFFSTNSRGNAFYTGSALRNKGRPRAVYFFTCENNMIFSEIFTCRDIMFSRESSPGISLVFM